MEANASFVTHSAFLAVVVISPDERWEKQEDRNLARTRALLEGLYDACNTSCARAMCTHSELPLAENTIKTSISLTLSGVLVTVCPIHSVSWLPVQLLSGLRNRL